ncbi:hypothetical protein J2848_005928 [Azospirillum lipoferum]|uniref:Uncharacterized protein n=1 Tax=Azospirillum lipoferum TaxID=193 RepID=A0A5A9GKG8_AZOLI|nr:MULTISPECIES: hypothetical protein [Azospirillum]KAA0593729.1 hypothetical protein FZ942_22830 [Azospirillum lipoferum]MCP1614225.1 hypothetical protein [Azospirillum lipoferum]MDW5536910.1 hypothetical protein [Azospirillum sp. NL1]
MHDRADFGEEQLIKFCLRIVGLQGAGRGGHEGMHIPICIFLKNSSEVLIFISDLSEKTETRPQGAFSFRKTAAFKAEAMEERGFEPIQAASDRKSGPILPGL